MDKPKLSTLEKLKESDLYLVNKLLAECGNYYYKQSNPSKPGPHTNPDELNSVRRDLLLIALKVGERLWYPRGNPGSTTSIDMPRTTNGKSKRKAP